MHYPLFIIIYVIALVWLSIYGLQAFILSTLFLLKWKHHPPIPPQPKIWPSVSVQLPVYNEKYVIKRLIDAVCQLDYPSDSLSIQVLDDSTDETTRLASNKVKYYRRHGVNITMLHRIDRTGFKAGALERALKETSGEFIAILDADFLPPKDFLRRLVPYLINDPQLGMVQARWGHLNADFNQLTRGQAMLIDGHFVIEQTARYRSGLLFNFNGSGGIWRKSCIIDSGSWQDDTLAEDLDLSYRAQLKGWRIAYLPEIVIPGELPPQIVAFKKQQYRWARGSIQVLRKQLKNLYKDNHLTTPQRLMAYLHISGYLTHPLMLILLISSLPVALAHGRGLPYMPWLSLAGIGAPLLFGLSQISVYHDWYRRLMNMPILLCLGMGIALNNTRAILAGLAHQTGTFERTPKFNLADRPDDWQEKKFRHRFDANIYGEIFLAAYAVITLGFAIKDFPPLIPAMFMFGLSFAYVAITGIVQSLPGFPLRRYHSMNSAKKIPSLSRLPPQSPSSRTHLQ
jgi:cellulose synthase/poly-beta-1,6-N-acetylglucosamine synthase-like glycosyltransferase